MRSLLYMLCFMGFISLNACARRVVVKHPNKITVVKVLPKQHKIVRVNGKRYFFWNGRHYRKVRNDYVLINL